MPEEEILHYIWVKIVVAVFKQPFMLVFFFLITAYWIFQSIKNYQKNKSKTKLYVGTLTVFFAVVVIPVSFILLTELLALRAIEYGFISDLTAPVIADIFRWIALYATICPLAFILTFRYNKFKSTLIAFAHISILLVGWLVDRWTGVFILSMSIFFVFYLTVYFLAQIIYPSSSSNNKEEKGNKFRALVWYIWGLQYPVWGAKNTVERTIETKISGNNIKRIGAPGVIHTYAHQVAGTSFGIEFSRVVGPGTAFLGRLERPTSIVDLRTQLRTVVDLDALTQDGVPIKCVLFMSFKIDTSSWESLDRKEEIHPLIRKAPVLRNGIKVDANLESSYPYSTARVQAALSVTGANEAFSKKDKAESIFWDETAVQRIAEIARIVISERSLNELWRPREDTRGASAYDEIAAEISERGRPRLREFGVELFAARVVNYIIPEKDPIREQLVNSWLTVFNQRIESIKLDGETDAEILRVRARTSAKDSFLQAIANKLKQARDINPNFPKQVIALNFISTLQQILETQDADAINQQLETLTLLRELSVRRQNTNT